MYDPTLDSRLSELPAPLRERVARRWQDYCQASDGSSLIDDSDLKRETLRVWAMSDFIAQSCVRAPAMLADLISGGELLSSYAEGLYKDRITALLEDVSDEQALGEILRHFRRREMVRIAWRDLSRRAELNETVGDLSALADACIDAALTHLYRWHCEQWGIPTDSSGQAQRLVVLGMGKLGAHELNFSSDVDLIFAYPEDGDTRGGRRCVSNQEFFIKLGQRLIQALSQNTTLGFVFRVDMRLRPFGESGALVLSFDAMEDYYQVHGREWERYAMVKARAVAGDKQAGAELLQRLKPFVYRRYVDYGAFESLREMKAMIVREVQRKGMEDNVKLGAGGIREVEFIGQAFQLIKGGREPTLQARRILTVLEALRGFRLLPDFVVDELVSAYVFLRHTEHRLQEFAEQQTHLLPKDEEGRERLAFAMGFEGWAVFERALRDHMRRVHEHFEQVFAAPQTKHAEADVLDLTGVWQGNLDEETAIKSLGLAGFCEPGEVFRRVQALRGGRSFLSLSTQGRKRMNHLIPLLLGAAGRHDFPDETVKRSLNVVEAVGRRTSYLALLVENPMALSQLVRLCGASPWIAALLARYPQLLDELLDPRSLYAPPRREELANELRQRMLRIPEDDLEQQMDSLRDFKQSNVLRVAAADVMEAMPLMVVSDHLTEIAEIVVGATVNIAWRHLIARHGRPRCGDKEICDTGFAVIAYGKFGGNELGYGSDLDLVFLYSGQGDGLTTDGERSVDNAVFYARLGQRIIHILNTRTSAGILYEVDTRLRPSGASGLLVSSVDAFAEYQRERAWTWEHQALVRARMVCGDPVVGEAFRQVRREVLMQRRDKAELQREVREMRERMRAELSSGGNERFDIKQDLGGIADIEFMVQYAVLAWACDCPALLDYTDNIRLLQTLADNRLTAEQDVVLLSDAYRAYRARVHRLTLQEQPAVVDDAEFRSERDAVTGIWRSLMER